jgi:hypothetical protein
MLGGYMNPDIEIKHIKSKIRILKLYSISYGHNKNSSILGTFSSFPDLKKAHIYPFNELGYIPDSYIMNNMLQIAFMETKNNKEKMELLAQDLCALLRY